MRHHHDLDSESAERMLNGRLGAADAPRHYAAVVHLLAQAAEAPELAAPHAAADTVAAMVEAVMSTPEAVTTPDSRRPTLQKFLSSKIAVAALVGGITLSGGVAAAATGSLPDAAQDWVSKAAEKAGFDLPASGRADDHKPAAETAEVETPETPDAAGHGEDVSTVARDGSTTGADKGEAVSTVASDGRSQAGTRPDPAPAQPAQNGTRTQSGSGSAPATPAPVPAPNGGGTGTGDTASGGASDSGTGEADDASGGRSSSGSGNAPAPGGGERP